MATGSTAKRAGVSTVEKPAVACAPVATTPPAATSRLRLETSPRQWRRVYLYGSTKTMKTTTAVMFPQPVVAQDSEMRGADFLTAPRVTIATVDDLAQFVRDVKGEPYQTVVLDDFANMVQRWVRAASAGKSDPRSAYKAVYAQIMPLVQALMFQPRHLVITGHYSREQELPAGGAKERAWVHPNLPDALEVWVLGMFDVIGYTFSNGTPSALVFENANDSRRIVAGSRAGLPFTQYAARSHGVVPLAALAQEVVK